MQAAQHKRSESWKHWTADDIFPVWAGFTSFPVCYVKGNASWSQNCMWKSGSLRSRAPLMVSHGRLLDRTCARSDASPVRSDIRLWSESYLIRSASAFTFQLLILFSFFGCWGFVFETALLFTSLCTFIYLFIYFALWACYSPDSLISTSSLLSAVLPSAGPASANEVCVCMFAHVCVCLLIYFFRSSCDALVERTVKISRISLPGWNTKPTGSWNTRASQVCFMRPWPMVYSQWSSKGLMKYIFARL